VSIDLFHTYAPIQVNVEGRTGGARICVPAWNAVVTAKSEKERKGRTWTMKPNGNALMLTVCRRENTHFQKPLSNGTPVPKLLNIFG
jgi:hypothetical protein